MATKTKATPDESVEIQPANSSATKKTATAKKPAAKKATAAKKPATKKPVAKKTAPVAQSVTEPPVKKVLFVSSEVLPFAASGGLGEVAGSLPGAINQASAKGYDVRVVMPYYKDTIPAEYTENFTFLGSLTVNLAWRQQYCGIYTLTRAGVTYYFLDNEYYYKRPRLYGEYDDGERFAFFSKAVLDILPAIDFYPDVLHCNDWQSALVPIYYKLYYMYLYKYEGIKTVFTIHNIEYQGKFDVGCCEDLFGIPARECSSISHDGCINLMKGAMDYADVVSTVSPTYANEITSDYFAHGLADVVGRNYYKLCGILNGIDVDGYNAATDKSIFVNFDRDTLDKKVENKLILQKMLHLAEDASIPMIAIITRLVTHKGIDLVKAAATNLIEMGVQLVVLGTGNAEFEAFFAHLATQYPSKVATVIAYNKDLSRKIYGSADIFLMPSKSEPCGLAQMIASRYATVPVVRETGGLYDSIADCGDGHHGNGYTFATYDAGDMTRAIERAVGLYRDYPAIWRELMQRVIDTDFSWSRSAKEYIAMYDKLLGDKYN